MRFARCIGNGGGDVVFLFFHGFVVSFFNVDAREIISLSMRFRDLVTLSV